MNSQTIVLAVLTVVLSAGYASAATSGVTINDAVKGNMYDFVFTVKNPSSNTTNYSIKTVGRIADWVFTDKKNVTLAGGSSVNVNGKIKIPSVIDSGVYTGNLTVEATENTKNNTVKSTIIPISINVKNEATSTVTTTSTSTSGATTVATTVTTSSTPASEITPTKTAVKSPGFGFEFVLIAIVICFFIRRKSNK